MKSPKTLFSRTFSPPAPASPARPSGRESRTDSEPSMGSPNPEAIRAWGVNTDTEVTDGPAPRNDRSSRWGPRPRKRDNSRPTLPTPSADTPPEMIPILSLLTAHAHRPYKEGYFMLLNDLSNDGRPVPNRQWVEVFGMLTGTVLSYWDAAALDDESSTEPAPGYINIVDSTFKSISKLPSPGGNLENIVVLSTTMKNRYLLQFPSPKMFQEWTAALRLSVFESTALQEAYTGALLSSKGSKLNGIRPMLGETRTKREDWCSIRFGAGMPWKRVWYVLTPNNLVKDKKDKKSGYGNIMVYESPKHIKKPPLATITRAFAAMAVFPERAVLMNVSSLIKLEATVKFSTESEEKESSVFIMPEQHPGIQGFETLIRFIIPLLDIYQLYGRPQRLNADKADIRSLLFAMPTLPRVYYLDVLDVVMLSALPNSEQWSTKEWARNIKEMLARKLATNYKGLGNIHDIAVGTSDRRSLSSSNSSPRQSSNGFGKPSSRDSPDSLAQESAQRNGLPNVQGLHVSQSPKEFRAVSQPNSVVVPGLAASPKLSYGRNGASPSPSSISNGVPPSPRQPGAPKTGPPVAGSNLGAPVVPIASQKNIQAQRAAPSRPGAPGGPGGPGGPSPASSLSPAFGAGAAGAGLGAAVGAGAGAMAASAINGRRGGPSGPRPLPHERSASEGQDPNNLIVNPGQGPLTPLMHSSDNLFITPQQTLTSTESLGKFSNPGSHSTASLVESHHSGNNNVFDPTYGGSAAVPVAPNLPDTSSHYSYAEYSEYMKAYLASGLKKPPTNSEEMNEVKNSYRSNKAEAVPASANSYDALQQPQHHQSQPQQQPQLAPGTKSPPRKRVPAPIMVAPGGIPRQQEPVTPVMQQTPGFDSPSALTSPDAGNRTNASAPNMSPYPQRPYARGNYSPNSSSGQLSVGSSRYASTESIPRSERSYNGNDGGQYGTPHRPAGPRMPPAGSQFSQPSPQQPPQQQQQQQLRPQGPNYQNAHSSPRMGPQPGQQPVPPFQQGYAPQGYPRQQPSPQGQYQRPPPQQQQQQYQQSPVQQARYGQPNDSYGPGPGSGPGGMPTSIQGGGKFPIQARNGEGPYPKPAQSNPLGGAPGPYPAFTAQQQGPPPQARNPYSRS